MKPQSLPKEKLVEFLYLLMRDCAPTGEIVRVVRMLDTSVDSTGVCNMIGRFTSPELQAYAERLAGELLQ